ncbi:unnamed protein product [Dovyalis caffra]|uniref:Uncharacterized protein n=1 Tax=Dovyalis caffra TaxID=77055 RepID=A0AAV1R815_9ROSI|nr:unnamed protein product [Dovyalis caffra]
MARRSLGAMRRNFFWGSPKGGAKNPTSNSEQGEYGTWIHAKQPTRRTLSKEAATARSPLAPKRNPATNAEAKKDSKARAEIVNLDKSGRNTVVIIAEEAMETSPTLTFQAVHVNSDVEEENDEELMPVTPESGPDIPPDPKPPNSHSSRLSTTKSLPQKSSIPI